MLTALSGDFRVGFGLFLCLLELRAEDLGLMDSHPVLYKCGGCTF